MNNYLLPEFTSEFNTLLNERVREHHHYGRVPPKHQSILTLKVLRELLNIELNPLTFEEVKAWFDRRVESKSFPDAHYEGECPHEIYGKSYYHYVIYEVNYYRNFYIAVDGFKYNLNSQKYPFSEMVVGTVNAHYSVSELLDVHPLELLCQMKGYVNR